MTAASKGASNVSADEPESTVHTVREVVAVRDRRSAGDDERLAARHRLEQGRRRAGVRVLAEQEAPPRAPRRGIRGRAQSGRRPPDERSRYAPRAPGRCRPTPRCETTGREGVAPDRGGARSHARIRAYRHDVVADDRIRVGLGSSRRRRRTRRTPPAAHEGLARPVVPRPPPSRTRRSCRGAGTHRRTLDSRSAPSAVRGARGDQSPRRRPVVSRGPACRGAQAECLPYRRSRTRHRSDSAR